MRRRVASSRGEALALLGGLHRPTLLGPDEVGELQELYAAHGGRVPESILTRFTERAMARRLLGRMDLRILQAGQR